MPDSCLFCPHDGCCDICAVGCAYDPELRQGDDFTESPLDWLEGDDDG